MGTYIYSCAEVKDSVTGEWEIVDKIFQVCSEYQPYKGNFTDAPFYWQSYNLFAFLANLRNDSGCPVITPPRGLPEDWFVEEEYPDCCYYGDPNQWVRGILQNYSPHSWLLLSELLEFDYDQLFEEKEELNTEARGVVNRGQSNPGLQLLEIMDPDRKPKESTVVLENIGRLVSVREHIGEEFFRTLDVLKTLGEPNNVRVVFWFG
ncbi:MAG: hypothetical protein JO235_10450 [Chroococcidiopsidaceae cyanobacterium CP_BM_RX_35]|nr:hypothetical protein [Chroococcidiopsidaceae cyanobacterium CP_BM_RX_35]